MVSLGWESTAKKGAERKERINSMDLFSHKSSLIYIGTLIVNKDIKIERNTTEI